MIVPLFIIPRKFVWLSSFTSGSAGTWCFLLPKDNFLVSPLFTTKLFSWVLVNHMPLTVLYHLYTPVGNSRCLDIMPCLEDDAETQQLDFFPPINSYLYFACPFNPSCSNFIKTNVVNLPLMKLCWSYVKRLLVHSGPSVKTTFYFTLEDIGVDDMGLKLLCGFRLLLGDKLLRLGSERKCSSVGNWFAFMTRGVVKGLLQCSNIFCEIWSKPAEALGLKRYCYVLDFLFVDERSWAELRFEADCIFCYFCKKTGLNYWKLYIDHFTYF